LTATQPDFKVAAQGRSIGRSMFAALRFLAIPAATAMAIVAALTLAVGSGATSLLPFLEEAHHAGATVTSLLLIPYLLASIVGRPLGGAWADPAGGGRPAGGRARGPVGRWCESRR